MKRTTEADPQNKRSGRGGIFYITEICEPGKISSS